MKLFMSFHVLRAGLWHHIRRFSILRFSLHKKLDALLIYLVHRLLFRVNKIVFLQHVYGLWIFLMKPFLFVSLLNNVVVFFLVGWVKGTFSNTLMTSTCSHLCVRILSVDRMRRRNFSINWFKQWLSSFIKHFLLLRSLLAYCFWIKEIVIT